MDELIEKVKQWGRDKNITNPDKQLCKVLEEVGEMAHEITRSHYDTDEMKDAIGDTLVTVIILSDILGFDPKDCLQKAYDEISGRTGKTIDGCFVKNI